MLVYLSKY